MRRRRLRSLARWIVRVLVPYWQPTTTSLVWAIRIVIVLGILSAVFALVWSLFSISLLAFVQLLLTASIPVVIAVVGNRYTQQRTQDDALQAYLDHMSDLLTAKDGPSLYEARPGDSLSMVARARTLTVLPRLNGERKARVVQFLYESRLIRTDRHILVLEGANLSGADLTNVNLPNINLSGADLFGAYLFATDLSGADLSGADLSHAYVSGALWSDVNLSGADLFRTYLPGSILRDVNLSGAYLFSADLSDADLTGADLSDAELPKAILYGATGITDEELDKQAKSLEGATIPNGQKYEDWLKSKNREEDG